MVPDEYDYGWKSALKYLKLDPSDLANGIEFETKFNRDYRQSFYPERQTRGGHPYYLPLGWYRHALRVLHKYEKDEKWIAEGDVEGAWAVAFHGTKAISVVPIAQQGLSTGAMQRDAMRDEAVEQLGEEANRPGVYVATKCEGGGALYAAPFTVTSSVHKTDTFRVVFQCRVKPEKYSVHGSPVRDGHAWRYVDGSLIRPYGILLKEEVVADETS